VADLAFTKDEQERLARGKYTSWATNLSDDDLAEVLATVGDFAAAAGSRLISDFPSDANVRLEQALFALLAVVFSEGSMFHYLPQIVDGVNEQTPSGPEPSVGLGLGKDRLEQDPRLRWAAHMSRSGLRQVLWLMGECGYRLDMCKDRSTNDEIGAQIQVALDSIRDSIMRQPGQESAT
jgi:hypothetical protein